MLALTRDQLIFEMVAWLSWLDLPAGRQGASFMYFVYIIRSKSTGKYYTGMTNDLTRRLMEHNGHHLSTKTTFKLTDYELVYSEELVDRTSARKREKYLKSGAGRELREKIVK